MKINSNLNSKKKNNKINNKNLYSTRFRKNMTYVTKLIYNRQNSNNNPLINQNRIE